MKRKVYLETSVVSYLMAWRSRDLVIAGNQETTREWWIQRDKFDLFISQFVLDEAAAGDGNAAAQRLRALEGIPELAVVEQVVDIADVLLTRAALPAKAKLDALHIAVAALHGMDFLLTWNCKHIANPIQRPNIEAIVRAFGYQPPIICTPQELLEAE